MPDKDRNERREFLRILDNIQDPKIRYFFLMLGEAIADQRMARQPPVSVGAIPVGEQNRPHG